MPAHLCPACSGIKELGRLARLRRRARAKWVGEGADKCHTVTLALGPAAVTVQSSGQAEKWRVPITHERIEIVKLLGIDVTPDDY